MLTDGELLTRYARNGSEEAFRQLAERHGPMVLAACRRLAPEDADDAVQAVFLALARKAGRLAGARDVGPWLHRVAVFTSVGALRESRRRREAEAAAMRGKNTSSAPTPEAEAARRELAAQLDAAIGGLSGGCRQAVVLCHLEGLSQTEAAERLGVPPGTVADRCARGLARLRSRLSRRGAALGSAALAAAMAESASHAAADFAAGQLLPSILAASKLAAAPAAAGAAGSAVVSLAEGALKAMFWMKVKVAVTAVAAAMAVSTAVPLTMAAVRGAEPAASVTEQGIECRVTAVLPGGKVTLSAGSAQGVREKFEFDVSRDGKPVGAVKVVTVEEKQSTAEIASVTGEIKVGDTARTRFGTVLAQPGERAPAPAEAGKIAWGEAVNGLQAGLIPLGGGAAKDWVGATCPKCTARPAGEPKAAGPIDPGTSFLCVCGKCGKASDSFKAFKFCRDCAQAERVCQFCGAAKPWGATFVEGETISCELHYRNIGQETLTYNTVCHLSLKDENGRAWRWTPPPFKGPPWPPPPERFKLAPGGYGCTIVLAGGRPGEFVVDAAGTVPAAQPVKALPAGKYTAVGHWQGGFDREGKDIWPTTGPVEIEIKPKGAEPEAGAPDEAAARRLAMKWIKDNNRDAIWRDVNAGQPIAEEQLLVIPQPNRPELWQITIRFRRGGVFGFHIRKADGGILLPVD